MILLLSFIIVLLLINTYFCEKEIRRKIKMCNLLIWEKVLLKKELENERNKFKQTKQELTQDNVIYLHIREPNNKFLFQIQFIRKICFKFPQSDFLNIFDVCNIVYEKFVSGCKSEEKSEKKSSIDLQEK